LYEGKVLSTCHEGLEQELGIEDIYPDADISKCALAVKAALAAPCDYYRSRNVFTFIQGDIAVKVSFREVTLAFLAEVEIQELLPLDYYRNILGSMYHTDSKRLALLSEVFNDHFPSPDMRQTQGPHKNR